MSNQIIVSNVSDDSLKHYGVVGMKWGVRRANYKTQSLSRIVRGTTKRFDKGREISEGYIPSLSRRVRQHKHKIDTKIRRAERFLDKGAKANAQEIVNRYNKDPEKK